jgi:hypothetical protein
MYMPPFTFFEQISILAEYLPEKYFLMYQKFVGQRL